MHIGLKLYYCIVNTCGVFPPHISVVFLIGCQQHFSWQNQPRLSSVGVAASGCVQWCSAHLQLSQNGDGEWKWFYSWHKKQLVCWLHLRPHLRNFEQLVHSSQALPGPALITCSISFCILQAIKNWRLRNETSLYVCVATWKRKHRQEMLSQAYAIVWYTCITFQTVCPKLEIPFSLSF